MSVTKKDAFLHYLDLGPNFNTQQEYLKQLLSDPKKAPVLIENSDSNRRSKRTGVLATC